MPFGIYKGERCIKTDQLRQYDHTQVRGTHLNEGALRQLIRASERADGVTPRALVEKRPRKLY